MFAFKFLILFVVISVTAIAQPKTINADTLMLKKKVKQEGNIVKALEWKEKTEKHFLVLCESLKDSNDERTAKLYAYHFIEKGTELELTDLNKNGILEIWIVYKTYCKGDVSQSTMKPIM